MNKYNVIEKSLEAREKVLLYVEAIVVSLFFIIGFTLIRNGYYISGAVLSVAGIVSLLKYFSDLSKKGDKK